jgi:hypothetical protein
MTSLRHALTSSLGSLCAAAALLTVVQYMRQVWVCGGCIFPLGGLAGELNATTGLIGVQFHGCLV